MKASVVQVRYHDFSSEGPGGSRFSFEQEENLIPFESESRIMLGPGDPGLQFEVQENLVPQEKAEVEAPKGDKRVRK